MNTEGNGMRFLSWPRMTATITSPFSEHEGPVTVFPLYNIVSDQFQWIKFLIGSSKILKVLVNDYKVIYEFIV